MERLRRLGAKAARTKPIASTTAGEGGLRKCLRLHDVVFFGLGATVGGGVFVATGEAAREAGPAVVLSFLLAAGGCAGSGLCYADLALLIPTAGSSYSFTYTALGELQASVIGSLNIFANICSAAAVARGCASYVALLWLEFGAEAPAWLGILDLGAVSVFPLASAIVLFVGAVNLSGTKTLSTMNNAVTALSVALLVLFVALGSTATDAAHWTPFMPAGVPGVFHGAGTVFFAFLGFDNLACLGEEVAEPSSVPRGILGTLAISTALYCLTGLVLTGLVSSDELEASAPLAAAALRAGLVGVARAVSIGAVGNTLTTVVSCILAPPRLSYAMARDGLLPACLGHVGKRGIPVLALVLTVLPCAVLAGLLDFEALAGITSAVALGTFSCVCGALLIIRSPKERDDDSDTDLMAWAMEPADAPSDPVEPDVIGATNGAAPSSPTAAPASPTHRRRRRRLRCVSVGSMIVLYALLCFCFGLTLRLPAGLRSPALRVGGGFVLAAAALICLRFHRSRRPRAANGGRGRLGSRGELTDDEEDEDSVSPSAPYKRDASYLPCMPLPPLVGIFMNMVLLSQLGPTTLARWALLMFLCILFYFVYGSHRSRLNDVEQVAFVDAELSDADPST